MRTLEQRLSLLEKRVGIKTLKESFSLNTSRFHALNFDRMQEYFTKELNKELDTHAKFDGSSVILSGSYEQEKYGLNYGEDNLTDFIDRFSKFYKVEIEKFRTDDSDEDDEISLCDWEIHLYDPNYDGSMMDNYYKNRLK